MHFPFVFVEKTAKKAGESMQHQFAGGAVKNALNHVHSKLALGFFSGLACFIDVGALAFIAADNALGGHDLKELENGGVAKGLLFAEGFVDFADSGRAAGPEDLQDFEFGGGGFLLLCHAGHHIRRFS